MVSLKLGFVPAIAGVGITLVVVPVQAALVSFVSKTRSDTARWTDERVRLTSELIQVRVAMAHGKLPRPVSAVKLHR